MSHKSFRIESTNESTKTNIGFLDKHFEKLTLVRKLIL